MRTQSISSGLALGLIDGCRTVERKQSISCGLACGAIDCIRHGVETVYFMWFGLWGHNFCSQWNWVWFQEDLSYFFKANLVKMSLIGHNSSPGYVWEACQTIHWMHRWVERAQSISCGLACGVIGGCRMLKLGLISGSHFLMQLWPKWVSLWSPQQPWICPEKRCQTFHCIQRVEKKLPFCAV